MGSVASILGRPSGPLPANRGQASTAERLDALHRASGTLTHDLNNLLGVILSATERLAEELPQGGEQQKLARLALEAAERSAELLRRGLAAAKAEDSEISTADCREVLDTLRGIARQAIAPGVDLEIHAPARPLRCVGDRTGLEMALLNLCLNADHATADGGQISVRVRETELDQSEARGHGLCAGAYAVFSVSDTGKGMSPDILARATDPLFTTRATGTGLGLSSAIDFAASAGGAFALRSREGHGTTATLYLPIAGAERRAVAA